jgi:hypothetical protein
MTGTNLKRRHHLMTGTNLSRRHRHHPMTGTNLNRGHLSTVGTVGNGSPGYRVVTRRIEAHYDEADLREDIQTYWLFATPDSPASESCLTCAIVILNRD